MLAQDDYRAAVSFYRHFYCSWYKAMYVAALLIATLPIMPPLKNKGETLSLGNTQGRHLHLPLNLYLSVCRSYSSLHSIWNLELIPLKWLRKNIYSEPSYVIWGDSIEKRAFKLPSYFYRRRKRVILKNLVIGTSNQIVSWDDIAYNGLFCKTWLLNAKIHSVCLLCFPGSSRSSWSIWKRWKSWSTRANWASWCQRDCGRSWTWGKLMGT